VRLRDLEAQLLRCVTLRTTERNDKGEWVWRGEESDLPRYWSTTGPERIVFEHVESVAQAHGIRFMCPKSFAKNGGPRGTHSVYIFFVGSPYAGRNMAGQEVRWKVLGGTTIDDLSISPSIQEQDDDVKPEHRCGWHGFIGFSNVPPGSAA